MNYALAATIFFALSQVVLAENPRDFADKIARLEAEVIDLLSENRSLRTRLAELESARSGPPARTEQSARTARTNSPESLIKKTFNNSIGQKMIWVPSGSFRMGDLTGNGDNTELPVRTVKLSDYYLAATEVTQQQWQAVMKSQPSKFKGGDLPVETVRWESAADFCDRLNEIERRTGRLPEGYVYSLPSEAQWENACRAGTQGDYAGDLSGMAWHHTNARYKTNPVASKKPNAWGFHDMHGNVWEWCLDHYQDSYYELGSQNPTGPQSGNRRVIRGGSWDSSTENNLRSSYRSNGQPTSRSNDLGFRVALVPAGSSSAAPTAGIQAETHRTLQESYTNGIGQQMIWVPSGSFEMGDLTGNGNSNAYPVRKVELSGYHLAATEVTQEQWKTVIGSNPSKFTGDDLPVETVSWNEAMEFCEKLTSLEKQAGRLPAGSKYVLPTEAQWENACRAGTESIQAEDLDAIAWHDTNSGNKTNPVAAKTPNNWGFHDLRGNVSEWCLDFYQDNYEGLGTRDPQGPAKNKYRVVRGGSWSSSTEDILLCSNRNAGYPSGRIGSGGFRVAMISDGKSPEASGSGGQPKSISRQFAKEDTFINGLNQRLIWVPFGSFRMGDLTGNGSRNEYPVRSVELSGYHLAATEVTQDQWKAVIGNNPSYFKGHTHPVEKVSWMEAMEFCKLLTYIERKEGRLPVGYVYSLPTEAQWENACRAGTEGDYAGELDDLAWHFANSEETSHPVATKQPNGWGFHDMHGNVSEWCLDSYQDSYAGLGTRDPIASIKSKHAAVRGGSWGSNSLDSQRSSYRVVDPPAYRHTIGFRVVLIPKGND